MRQGIIKRFRQGTMIVFVIITTMVACSDTQNTEPFVLHIAHINDTHSAFDPVFTSFEAPISGESVSVYTDFGGHPRLLAKANAIREQLSAEQSNFLFLHGGDAWQGSAYFLLNEGQMNAQVLSRFGLDAMALGNHEFDLNNAKLNQFIDAVNFPLLAANIDASQDPDLQLQDNLLPYVIYGFRDGHKQRVSRQALAANGAVDFEYTVAVMGLVLEDMPNISPETGALIFHPMIATAQAMVDELEAMGIDHIVALTHIGHLQDMEIAQQVNGIDVIVGGHSHTLLGDMSHLGWGADGVYAESVLNPNGRSSTCIVQAGQYAQALGLVRIEFSRQGEVAACEGGNTLLVDDVFYKSSSKTADTQWGIEAQQQVVGFVDTQSGIERVTEHADLRSLIDSQFKPELDQAYGEVIGFVPADIPHVRRPGDHGSGVHGSALAPLIAYAHYHYFLQPEVQAVTERRPDFALVGAGGIRKSIQQGELREGHISLEVLPFGTSLSIVELSGREVKDLLTQVINATLPEGAHAGKFPYGGNLRYGFKETEIGVSGELFFVEVNRGSRWEPDWQPLENNQSYQVVMNSYSAAGNDGWDLVFEVQQNSARRVDVIEVGQVPVAFPVTQMIRDDQGGLRAVYERGAPDCELEHANCALDAQSVINFLKTEGADRLAIPYPVVTLERLQQ